MSRSEISLHGPSGRGLSLGLASRVLVKLNVGESEAPILDIFLMILILY